jgi:hypothetical protein
MTHLLHDRYMRLEGDRACDLATGNEVRLDALVDASRAESDAGLRPVLEALDHGRDGYPRWVVVAARNRRQATATIERVAAAAVRRGFVAISIEAFLRFRAILRDELRDRTLLLIGTLGADRGRSHAALLEASSLSPRPHLLLTFRPGAAGNCPVLVREARTAYLGSDPGEGTNQGL